MRDLLLVTPASTEAGWTVDIDIVNGVAVETPDNVNTTPRQRVAVASYICRGTIPGREDIGADWAGYLAGRTSLLECDNQVKANMETFASASKIAESPYPIYYRDENGVRISLLSLRAPSVVGANA